MIRLRSLGECVIDLGEVQVGPQSEVLFALLLYLIVERGHRVPRTRLVELLWPGESDERARHNLRQAIYKARQLGAAIGQEGGDFVLLATAASADYDALLAPPVDGSAPSVDLATLDFLPSFDGAVSEAYAEWLDDQRAVIHSALRRHLVAAIARARRLVRWNEVERLARRCLALDPMNEEAVIGLAEAIAASGSRAVAAATLDRYLEELGPDAKLLGRSARELRRRIAAPREGEPQVRRCFVGREDELAMLAKKLDDATRSEGGLILLWGAPGIGKSALLREVTELARLRGFLIASAFTQYAAQPQPLSTYTATVEALLQLPGALGCAPQSLHYCELLTGSRPTESQQTPIDAEALQRRIRDAVLELAQSVTEEGPLLITLEDLHWADATSVERIADLASSLSQSRALVILTGRQSLVRLWPRSLLGVLMSSELRGLSIAESKELLALRAGERSPPSARYSEWCAQIAEGHPLYLRELGDRWRLWGESYRIPPSLLSLLTARIDNLSPAALRAVQFCALLGRDSTLRRLEDLLGLPSAQFSDVVEELELADVAIADADSFVVRHELLAETALRRAPEGTRRTLHKRLALLLEGELPSTGSAAISWRCAEHWLMAGEPSRAGSAVEASASRLIGIGHPGEAASLLRTYLAGDIAPDDRARAVRLYLAAQRYMGHWSNVLSTARAEASLRYTGVPRHDTAELHVREAAWRGEHTSLHELLASAEACASAIDADPDHRIQSAIQAQIFAADLMDLDGLRRIHTAACRSFPYHPAADLAVTRLHLIYHTIAGELDFAVELARRSIARAEECGNPVILALCLRNSLIPLRMAGRLHEALWNGKRALDLALTSQIPDAVATTAATLALTSLALGANDDARRYADQATSYLPELEPLNGRSNYVTAAVTVAFHQGDFAQAASWVPRISLPIEREATLYSLETRAMHAIAAVINDRADEVSTAVRELVQRVRQAAPRGAQDTNASITAFCLLHLDRFDEALTFLSLYASERRERFPLAPLLAWLHKCPKGTELLQLLGDAVTTPPLPVLCDDPA